MIYDFRAKDDSPVAYRDVYTAEQIIAYAKDNMPADQLKAKIGRPVNQEFQRTKIRTVRLTDADFAKLKELGTDRLRAWLRKAKP